MQATGHLGQHGPHAAEERGKVVAVRRTRQPGHLFLIERCQPGADLARFGVQLCRVSVQLLWRRWLHRLPLQRRGCGSLCSGLCRGLPVRHRQLVPSLKACTGVLQLLQDSLTCLQPVLNLPIIPSHEPASNRFATISCRCTMLARCSAGHGSNPELAKAMAARTKFCVPSMLRTCSALLWVRTYAKDPAVPQRIVTTPHTARSASPPHAEVAIQRKRCGVCTCV